MTLDPLHADQVADLLLPLDGPYPPDQVVEAARTVGELVRRLNHATFHRTTLRYPPQMYRTLGALRSALYGLEQTFDQLAARLDAFATDPQVGHDNGHDPAPTCADAARQLRHAAAAVTEVTAHLNPAHEATSHLSYDTTTARQPHGHPFRPPAATDPPSTPSPPAGQSQPGASVNRARPR
jgi:hypothetical protein